MVVSRGKAREEAESEARYAPPAFQAGYDVVGRVCVQRCHGEMLRAGYHGVGCIERGAEVVVVGRSKPNNACNHTCCDQEGRGGVNSVSRRVLRRCCDEAGSVNGDPRPLHRGGCGCWQDNDERAMFAARVQ